MSGHSKWSQIKHKKALTDAKRGKMFSKLVREVMIASKTGGKTETNVRLRAAVERAKQMGVPKDNIERAASRGSGESTGVEFKEFLYEATGPGGIAILIEGSTDNTNRTVNEIKHLLAKQGGRLAEPGSLLWNFQKIGILEINAEQNAGTSKDAMEFAFIESVARDFFPIENGWIVETGFTDRDNVRRQLEEKGIIVASCGHDYKPGSVIALGPDAAAAADTLLDALTDHDDVQEAYTNLQE